VSPHENQAPGSERARVLVTSRDFIRTRQMIRRLRRALPHSDIHGAGFMGVFEVEAEGASAQETAERISRSGIEIGHLTAVLAEVPTKLDRIQEAAVRVAREQVGEEETFCFRIHKRGSHGLELESPRIEREIGSAIWEALEERFSKEPRVRLTEPDVAVVAEVLGETTLVGVSRRTWHAADHDHNSMRTESAPGGECI